MSNIYIKAVAIVLFLFLLSGCAVFIGDGGRFHHRHRGYWRGSSLDDPSQAATQLAFNHEDHHLDQSTGPSR